ncbi:hypothetical protein SGPA1_50763 [Streptomyces misionensis JCM 4497]
MSGAVTPAPGRRTAPPRPVLERLPQGVVAWRRPVPGARRTGRRLRAPASAGTATTATSPRVPGARECGPGAAAAHGE